MVMFFFIMFFFDFVNLSFEIVNAIVFSLMMSRNLEMRLSAVLFRFFISPKDSHKKSRDRLISTSSDSSVALAVRFSHLRHV